MHAHTKPVYLQSLGDDPQSSPSRPGRRFSVNQGFFPQGLSYQYPIFLKYQILKTCNIIYIKKPAKKPKCTAKASYLYRLLQFEPFLLIERLAGQKMHTTWETICQFQGFEDFRSQSFKFGLKEAF